MNEERTTGGITPTYAPMRDPLITSITDRTPLARAVQRNVRRAVREEMEKRSPKDRDGNQLLTKKDVAARLQCSPRKVDTLAAEGRIPKTKIGRLVRFAPEAVDAYIRRQTSCEGA